jgi:3-hydroxyisobutyrate dehydrogenase-like beta-hydroxyacid dehydrogenase
MGLSMRFAILGLGEAGGALAADLIAREATVFGWDPEPKNIPEGVHFMAGNQEAVSQADIILSVNWARVSIEVATEILPVLGPHQLYADMNTASPNTKKQIANLLHPSGALFADVAIMAPVLPRGIGTSTMVSGLGAEKYQELMAPYGMPVAIVDNKPGSAATRKLLRSVFYKGLAAVIIEAQEAARQLECEAWLREQILAIIPDEQIIERMIDGSRIHAERRIHEMAAVSDMLREIGVTPYTSGAAVQWLTKLQQAQGQYG